jgi:hypothetical protein
VEKLGIIRGEGGLANHCRFIADLRRMIALWRGSLLPLGSEAALKSDAANIL